MTDLNKLFGDDILSRDLFLLMLEEAATGKEVRVDERTKRKITLERGQLLFNYREWAERMRIPQTSLYRIIKVWNNLGTILEQSTSKRITVITIKNYNDFSVLEQSWNNRVTIAPNEQIFDPINNHRHVYIYMHGNVKQLTLPLNITSNELNIADKIKEKRTKRKEKKAIVPLTHDEIWEIAKRYSVSYYETQQVHRDIMDSIEFGDKYKVKNVKMTLVTWLKLAIKRGDITPLTPDFMRLEFLDHDPSKADYRERKRLMIEKIENGTYTPPGVPSRPTVS